MSSQSSVAFIGGGNMARSLIGGLIARGTAPADIHVAEPVEALREALAADFGVHAGSDNGAAAGAAGLWVLAVKPQVMDTVFPPVAKLAGPGTLVVSIAAGRTLASFEARMETMIDTIKSSRLADEGGVILFPGERAQAEERRRRVEGIPLARGTFEALCARTGSVIQ